MERRLQRLRAPAPPIAGEWPQAAVLVALDSLTSPLSVVLTLRADHLRLHAGEVAFPGGKCDADDRDFWHTATREALEEIALPPENLRFIGVLDSLVTRTGIEVVPCVASLEKPTAFRPNPDELVAVFEAPLHFFARPENLYFDTFEYGGRQRRVPRYEWKRYTIWGITAAILVQLANIACDASLDMEPYWLSAAEALQQTNRSNTDNS